MSLRVIALTAVFASCISSGAWAREEFSREQIREVEQMLTDQGFDSGWIDGRFRNATARAIRHFQKEYGLPIDGELSDDLIGSLRDGPPSRWTPLEKRPDCQVWTIRPQARETINWTGDCVDGKASGAGDLTRYFRLDGKWRSLTYQGDMVAGKRHGRGSQGFAHNEYYEGDWVEDERTGHGVYTWSFGIHYEGDFVAGEMKGKGVLNDRRGRYEGDFAGNLRHGRGAWLSYGGDHYEGEWREGYPSGKGRIRMANGSSFEGPFEKGAPHGLGKYESSAGLVLYGEFVHGCLRTQAGTVWLGATQGACE